MTMLVPRRRIDQYVVRAQVGVGEAGHVQPVDGAGHPDAEGEIIPPVTELGGSLHFEQFTVLAPMKRIPFFSRPRMKSGPVSEEVDCRERGCDKAEARRDDDACGPAEQAA